MATLKDLLPAPTDGFACSTEEAADTTPSPGLQVIPAKPSVESGVSKVLTLPEKESGEFDYSAIVRQGENAARTVHTSASALVEKPREEVLNPLPDTEEEVAATERTRAALQKIVSGKIAAASRGDPSKGGHHRKPSFVRYTPANTNTETSSGQRQRIIKLVEAPVDPMLPPRFARRKAPVNPPSPPVPVMHSPERKMSKAEAENWKIPPVVSNWKNNRGYTISLEKRLAAEGRDLVNHSINDRFAAMADALYAAERSSRAEVEKRAQLQMKVSLRAKEEKERKLRELAENARRERKGYIGISDATDSESVAPSEGRRVSEAAARRATEEWLQPSMGEARPVQDDAPPTPVPNPVPTTTGEPPRRRRRSRFAVRPDLVQSSMRTDADENVDDEAIRRRDAIRRERREARERELRRREVHGDESTAPTLKRSKLSRDQGRDLVERVALGQQVGSGAVGGEVLYDQRLFNQDGGGGKGSSLAGGFGADDAYNLYDKPLFDGGNASSKFLYRPPRNADGDADGLGTDKVRADKAFAGGDGAGGTNASKSGGARDRPVEFERDTDASAEAGRDPYGLDKFFNEARQFDGKQR